MEESRQDKTFLTVAEAAERLGMSRLRVREAVAMSLIKSRRDNEGRLRIDLPDVKALTQGAATDLEPDAIIEFLFDDIEELETEIDAREAQITRLTALLKAQDDALERSDQVLTEAQNDKARLADLLDRAFLQLEAAGDREKALQRLSERGLETLEAAVQSAEAEAAKAARLHGLLDRAMALAEQGDTSLTVADRSLDLLDDALSQAEAAQFVHDKQDDLIQRSLTAAEVAHEQAVRKDRDLQDREAALEKTLAMSERAAALAEENQQAKPRRGFLRRLLGF